MMLFYADSSAYQKVHFLIKLARAKQAQNIRVSIDYEGAM